MQRLLIIFAAFALTSCAAEIIGPHVETITGDDLRQLQAIASSRPDIHHRSVGYVRVIRPGCVSVYAMTTFFGGVDGIRSTTFTACKRDGKWIVDESSINNYDDPIVTS